MNAQVLHSYKDNSSRSYDQDRKVNRNTVIFLRTIALLAFILIVSVLYLKQLSTLNHYRAEISRLNIEKKRSIQRINNLNVIAARLSSFERIRRIAEEELGMVKSTDIEYVEIGGKVD